MKIEDSSKHSYYNDRVNRTSNNFEGYLEQVGKSYLGKVIDHSQFSKIINSIVESLKISKNDDVVDLGCANGLITKNISIYAKSVTGYDYNNELLRVANDNHGGENITYIKNNIMDIDFNKVRSNKFYMYAVLQYIDYKYLRILLKKVIGSRKKMNMFIGDIPDMSRILNFYHTKERRKFLFEELIENNKTHVGYWWYKEHISQVCDDLGLEVEILKQNDSLCTSHYRFDALISK